MKRYAEDKETFMLRAIEAAWLTDPKNRLNALTLLFWDCGLAAKSYAEPAEVAALFVHSVAETFTAERLAQKETAA